MLRTLPAQQASSERLSPFNRIPSATYRLQLSRLQDFEAVEQVIDYLDELGITDLYLSPLFRSRDQSSHGYDIVSHGEVEPAFGGIEALHHLTDSARARGMGVLLDVVPNHMGINDSTNELWWDVLENGPLSQYAHFFDIEWDPPAATLKRKLLLPFLGDPFGTVLERGELQLVYESDRIQLAYGPKRYPLSPANWTAVLDLALELLVPERDADEAAAELASISTQLANLPSAASNNRLLQGLYREQAIARQRLRALVDGSKRVQDALHRALKELNGAAEQPTTFDRLEALLNAQWYRLAYWRVAADEINYRRFFDINDLAAIRVEEPDVFEHVHTLVRELLSENRITGLRVDHPDGLFDPEGYFNQLQRLFEKTRAQQVGPTNPNEQLYIVAEKILSGKEELPLTWPVAGTTGYDVMNTISQVLVDDRGLPKLTAYFNEISASSDSPANIVYKSKREILAGAMSSELQMLTGQLHRIAQQSRAFRDFTFVSLQRALQEVIACFPVYRTYVRPSEWDVEAHDQRHIALAIRNAKLRNPTISRTIFDFIGSLLHLDFPDSLEKPERDEWRQFVLKFQQVTGPVTAKGIEDTAFYRYFPLASLNEVGGELTPRTCDVGEFHLRMQRRMSDWPHAMSATATHDTKRGEDARARLHVLSEDSERWINSCKRWDKLALELQQPADDTHIPSAEARHLLFQTLVATSPSLGTLGPAWSEYTERIIRYFEKALREAKLHTSWTNPDADYEKGALEFAGNVLDANKSAELLHDIDAFAASIADAGYINALSQLVLKSCMPGAPDFYQGTELWDFNLVDPDNRRPVDFHLRQRLLRDLVRQFERDPRALVTQLVNSWPDPRIKLYIAWRLLQTRRDHDDLFTYGKYVPLKVTGPLDQHILAFARTNGSEWAIVVVPRLVQRLIPSESRKTQRRPLLRRCIDWRGTAIELPREAGVEFVDVFTSDDLWSEKDTDASIGSLLASCIFDTLPVSVLMSRS